MSAAMAAFRADLLSGADEAEARGDVRVASMLRTLAPVFEAPEDLEAMASALAEVRGELAARGAYAEARCRETAAGG